MKMRTVFFLTLIVLLATACGTELVAPTSQPIGVSTEPVATEAIAEAATPSATETITA